MKLHVQLDVRLVVRIMKRNRIGIIGWERSIPLRAVGIIGWERSIPLRAAHLPYQIDVPCRPHALSLTE